MRVFLIPLLSFFCFCQVKAQTYCTAGSNGAGNLFGGNVLSLTIQDDTGIVYSYIGLTNNSTAPVQNSGSPFKLVSWDSLFITMSGVSDSTGNAMYTKAGIWIDINRDGDFSASECIADPVNGPFNHLRKDSSTSVIIRLPGPAVTGASRLRIRGAANNQTLTSANGCGTLSVYGNQFDFEITLFQGVNNVQGIGTSNIYFNIFPNPGSGRSTVYYNLPKDENAMLSISDMTGKEIFKQAQKINGEGNIDLDLQSFPAGTYVLQMVSGSAKYVRRLQIVKS